MELETKRLLLRPFTPRDGEDLFRLYGDAQVMAIRKIGTQSRTESDAQLAEIVAHWARRGFGLWAVIEQATGRFIGECGLREIGPGNDDIELSYGLIPETWGRGYATEASRVVLARGFGELGLPEIFALGRKDNDASLGVMNKLGLTLEAEWARGPYKVVRQILRRADWEANQP